MIPGLEQNWPAGLTQVGFWVDLRVTSRVSPCAGLFPGARGAGEARRPMFSRNGRATILPLSVGTHAGAGPLNYPEATGRQPDRPVAALFCGAQERVQPHRVELLTVRGVGPACFFGICAGRSFRFLTRKAPGRHSGPFPGVGRVGDACRPNVFRCTGRSFRPLSPSASERRLGVLPEKRCVAVLPPPLPKCAGADVLGSFPKCARGHRFFRSFGYRRTLISREKDAAGSNSGEK